MLRTFGHYLLEERIATGGMARVYRARLRGLGGFEKTLVVKQILPELASDPRFVRMFVEEAKAAVRLSHPHIVPVYELGEVDGTYFLAMEFVEGASVAELLHGGPLDPAAAAHLGAQLADALDYAHGQGLVHRDVTPRNVLVDRAGHARLLDFGVAAPADAETPVFGTPGYMAPEQARGEVVDGRADVFALGALLYEALEGRPAFPGARSARAAREAVVSSPPSPMRSGVPGPVREAIERALRLHPDERFADAASLGRALRSWLASAHPAGVAEQLGERVARVLTSRRQEPEEDDEVSERSASSTAPVRTLATAPTFSRLLSEEPPAIEAPRTVGSAQGDDDPQLVTVPLAERARNGERQQERTPRVPFRGAQVPRGSRGARRRVVVVLWGAALLSLGAGVLWLLSPGMQQEGGERNARAGRLGAGGSERLVDDAGAEALPPSSAARSVERSEAFQRTPDGGGASPAHAAARRGAGGRRARPERSTGTSVTESARAGGWLSVSALPWAEVYLDGRYVGRTPLRSRPVRAGRRRVRLVCPPLGVRHEQDIEVVVGARLRVEADLEADPPKMRVRSLSTEGDAG